MKRSFTAIKSRTVLDNAIDFLKAGCWVGALDEGDGSLVYGLNHQVLHLRAEPQILVFAESARTRGRIRRYFGTGFRVAEAANQKDAERLARHLNPALIVATHSIATDGCLTLRLKRIQQAGIAPAPVFLLTDSVLQAMSVAQKNHANLRQSTSAKVKEQQPMTLIGTTS